MDAVAGLVPKYILNLHSPFYHCCVAFGLVVPPLASPLTGVPRDGRDMTPTVIIPLFAYRLPLFSDTPRRGIQINLNWPSTNHNISGLLIDHGNSKWLWVPLIHTDHLAATILAPFRVPRRFYVSPLTAQAFKHPYMVLDS